MKKLLLVMLLTLSGCGSATTKIKEVRAIAGSSCTVEQVDNAALITCTDGTSALVTTDEVVKKKCGNKHERN
jgi:uncharacterized protein YceK